MTLKIKEIGIDIYKEYEIEMLAKGFLNETDLPVIHVCDLSLSKVLRVENKKYEYRGGYRLPDYGFIDVISGFRDGILIYHIFILPEYRRKGLARMAVTSLNCNNIPIYAYIHQHNTISQCMFTSCGFKRLVEPKEDGRFYIYKKG